MELDVAAVLERRPQRTGQALVRERITNRVLEQALAGYFQSANLIALRERVMVCLTPAPSATAAAAARVPAGGRPRCTPAGAHSAGFAPLAQPR